MHIIKVDATDSTNTLARELFRKNKHDAVVCIQANQQLKGRGQMGTTWLAKPGQNLTFSILFPKPELSLEHQFLLSAAVSTAIVDCLRTFHVPRLKVKWPNDILSGNYKIGGILIENIISDARLAASIMGIGLNVNQTEFQFPSAGSLKLVTGQHFSLEELLEKILAAVQRKMETLSDLHSSLILNDYKKNLFHIGKPSTFQAPDGNLFIGMITDISQSGKLVVRLDENMEKEFDLKEIKLLY